MATTLIAHYRRWFDYEQDAHEKVVKSLESVPPERHSSTEYRKAIELLAHIAGARRVWLGRLGVAPPVTGPLFPADAKLPEVVDQLHMVHALWRAYFDKLTDTDLEQVFEYQSLDAGRFRNRL